MEFIIAELMNLRIICPQFWQANYAGKLESGRSQLNRTPSPEMGPEIEVYIFICEKGRKALGEKKTGVSVGWGVGRQG